MSLHVTEVIPRAGGLFEPHCQTCNWRPAEYAHNHTEAEAQALEHERKSAQGLNQIANRGIGMAPTIRHARDMAQRETTPKREAAEWNRLADEMERQQKVSSRTRTHEILEGQEALFEPPTKGATP